MVIFRSANLRTAADVLQGMLGLHGIGLSGLTELRDELGVSLRHVALWIAAPAFIALVCPNTLQILSPYEPALGWKLNLPIGATGRTQILWRPSLVWAAAISIIAAIGILNLGGNSEFLYWQF